MSATIENLGRTKALSANLLKNMHACWRAANYLSVGQIYLFDNPLLKKPLKLVHVKPRLLGHWGTTPGLNFIYVHLNCIIKQYDLNMLYVTGPGGPGIVANTYLGGSYSEFYPEVSQDELGLKRLFKQFSFPGGIPSHVAAETQGSISVLTYYSTFFRPKRLRNPTVARFARMWFHNDERLIHRKE